ncbi:MAG: hypothetical protein ACRC6M_07180, partial [Microcystaceae cyanobacterium]
MPDENPNPRASKQFTDDLKVNNSPIDAFLTAIEKAINLEVVTVIETKDDDKASRNQPMLGIGTTGQTLYTRIDLVQGDI